MKIRIYIRQSIRAFENSGIIMPMIRQLGLDIDLVKNNVSIGIEQDVVNLVSADSLLDYQTLLNINSLKVQMIFKK